MGLIVRDADVDGFRRDVRLSGGVIAGVGPKLAKGVGDEELDADGGSLIPGLHDHHIHLTSWAAALSSVAVGPPDVQDRRAFEKALLEAARASDGWIRAVGYHESVAGDLDRHVLDRIVADRPVRVQHRSGVLWVLNSRALDQVGAEGDRSQGIERGSDGLETGRLWRMDHWLAGRLARSRGTDPAQTSGVAAESRSLASLSRQAAARGVTGWTDATPTRTPDQTRTLVDSVEHGAVVQRLHLMTSLDAALPAGRVTSGPVKVMLDDSALPPFEHLSDLMSSAHRAGRGVAVHCVTRVQLALTVAALEASLEHSLPIPERDRIEHGADIPPGFIPLLAEHRLTVVTQPNFVFERGDQYLNEIDPDELVDLWRARSLIEGGVPVAAGTDAPFGSPDPWLAVRSSMRRVTRAGRRIGAIEALDWRTALELWHGTAGDPPTRRTVEVGQPADLVLLGGALPAALEGDGEVPVRATVIAGEVAFHG